MKFLPFLVVSLLIANACQAQNIYPPPPVATPLAPPAFTNTSNFSIEIEWKTSRHAFHPKAVLEFEEAVQFYKERGRILGQRFAKEIRAKH